MNNKMSRLKLFEVRFSKILTLIVNTYNVENLRIPKEVLSTKFSKEESLREFVFFKFIKELSFSRE